MSRWARYLVLLTIASCALPRIAAPQDIFYPVGDRNVRPHEGSSSLLENGYRVTRRFSGTGGHTGVDLANGQEGGEVRAVAAGTVTFVQEEPLRGFGNLVRVRHEVASLGVFYSQYAHLRGGSITVARGDPVIAGQPIGLINCTGYVEGTSVCESNNRRGPHLHFSIQRMDRNGCGYLPDPRCQADTLSLYLDLDPLEVIAELRESSERVFRVDTTADAPDAAPGDGACATVEGRCSLRAAIQEANALGGADVVVVPAGRYFLSVSGSREDSAATGDLDIADDLEIRGANSATTIVSANGIDRVFDVMAGARVRISNITIEGGVPPERDGGGGGIRNAGILTVQALIVSMNSVTGCCGGGGIYNTGSMEVSSTAIFQNVVRGCCAGGGVWNAGTMMIADSSIAQNEVHDCCEGGGIDNDGTLTLVRVEVSNNLVQGCCEGGGISNDGTLNSTDTTIAQNRVNECCEGGGVANDGTAVLTSTTVSGNVVQGCCEGGGIDNDATLMALSSTVAENGVLGCCSGGGIATRGSLAVRNTIVARSTSGGDCVGAVTSHGHNLDSDGSCGFQAAGDLSSVEPRLGALADNGGPTRTHALLPNSPAIDAGDNLSCPAQDQRGLARPIDGNADGVAVCDIGVYEFR